mmetsp:Transcript_64904/g.155005  ORF Transcript_64904/g.155005 Transcript_64904/m.155005 type:complete len:758 (+) Transcript_64904:61-2334(+)
MASQEDSKEAAAAETQPEDAANDGSKNGGLKPAKKGLRRRASSHSSQDGASSTKVVKRRKVAASSKAATKTPIKYRDVPQRPNKKPKPGEGEASGAGAEKSKEDELENTDDDEETEIPPTDSSSDDSEDDAPRNRIGNVPLEWYDDQDHVGYDLAGEKIMRTLSGGEIDALLESKDNPNAWRTIKDHKNQREVVLTDTDLEIIRRIRARMYPSGATDTMEMVEFDNPDAKIHPLHGDHPPKSRFLPSKWERMHIKKLTALLREGKIRPPPPPKPEVFDLWVGDAPSMKKMPRALPAPKTPLPGHAESYNPPKEYLFNEDEKKQWEDQDETERQLTHIPKQYDALRRVPAYKDLITERFKRCLDLYLVPRALKQRLNVDPESLLPKLPNPKDLRPFPTHVAVVYEGHTGMVRSVAVDSTGQWLATASSDETVRIWEVSTGRCYRAFKFAGPVTAVAWNPKHPLLAIAADSQVFFADAGIEKRGEVVELLKWSDRAAAAQQEQEAEEGKTQGAKAKALQWKQVPESSALYKSGCRLVIASDGDVQQLCWHVKGNYCAAISPKAKAASNACIVHALHQQKSMHPFAKPKGGAGNIQACAFSPSKPLFYVATKRSIRAYDLVAQKSVKTLISGASWIGSLSMHPSGEHLAVGSYDRKIVWFDLDLGTTPYKTLQYHERAVRRASFHQGKYPLLAAASDDATVSVLYAHVSDNLLQGPMIVPVKRLVGHAVHQGFGVLDCTWHPTQPWLFSAGADHRVLLWA